MRFSMFLASAVVGNVLSARDECQDPSLDFAGTCDILYAKCAPNQFDKEGSADIVLAPCNVRISLPNDCTMVSPLPFEANGTCTFAAECNKKDHNGHWIVRNEVTMPANTWAYALVNKNGALTSNSKGFVSTYPSWRGYTPHVTYTSAHLFLMGCVGALFGAAMTVICLIDYNEKPKLLNADTTNKPVETKNTTSVTLKAENVPILLSQGANNLSKPKEDANKESVQPASTLEQGGQDEDWNKVAANDGSPNASETEGSIATLKG